MIVVSRNISLAPTDPQSWLDENSPLIAWHNVILDTTTTADSEDTDFPAVNVANPASYLKWKSLTTDIQYFTIHFEDVEPEETDYIAIAGHNLGSTRTSVKVETFIDGAWTELVQEVMPADDTVIIFRYTRGAYGDIRFKFGIGTAPPELAVVYLGRILVLQRRIYVGHIPITYGRSTEVVNGMSESGVFLGRIILRETNGTSFTMNNIMPDWYRTYMDPFIQAAREYPFFFSWRPGDYPLETGFAWITNNPQPSNARANGMMQITLQMGGVVQ